mgnify:CR=1 FL=1
MVGDSILGNCTIKTSRFQWLVDMGIKDWRTSLACGRAAGFRIPGVRIIKAYHSWYAFTSEIRAAPCWGFIPVA